MECIFATASRSATPLINAAMATDATTKSIKPQNQTTQQQHLETKSRVNQYWCQIFLFFDIGSHAADLSYNRERSVFTLKPKMRVFYFYTCVSQSFARYDSHTVSSFCYGELTVAFSFFCQTEIRCHYHFSENGQRGCQNQHCYRVIAIFLAPYIHFSR